MVDMMRSMLSPVVDTNNATKKLLEEYIENRTRIENTKRKEHENKISSGNNSKNNSLRIKNNLTKDDEINLSGRNSINYSTQLNDSEIYRNFSTDELYGSCSTGRGSKCDEDFGSISRGNSIEGNTISHLNIFIKCCIYNVLHLTLLYYIFIAL